MTPKWIFAAHLAPFFAVVAYVMTVSAFPRALGARVSLEPALLAGLGILSSLLPFSFVKDRRTLPIFVAAYLVFYVLTLNAWLFVVWVAASGDGP